MLKINKPQVEEIIEHAKASLPREACGILAGKDNKVKRIYKMTNVSEIPEKRYLMNPEEQFKVMKEMRNLGLEMLAIYHSHTGTEAYPSERDLELAFYPEVAHVIISLQNIDSPEVKAFKIVDGKVSEEEIRT